MRILISSAGRRVGLIRCFRDSFQRLGISGEIVAIDVAHNAPALQFADFCWQAPPCQSPDFLSRLLHFAAKQKIDLIVPTIDPELPVYAVARTEFERAGIEVIVSSAETVAICADKQRTHHWLEELGIPVPRQVNLAAITSRLSAPNHSMLSFPQILKPRHGSGSAGIRRIDSFRELEIAIAAISITGSQQRYVLEECAHGQEYTINTFVDFEGRCLAAVPHQRLEVRAGEVSKAVTTKHTGLIRLAQKIAAGLPGARGPLNIQCFLNGDAVLVTEINARFGGGYPLTHQAGARFTDWLLEPLLRRNGNAPKQDVEDWTDQLTMLRFDNEVFLPPVAYR